MTGNAAEKYLSTIYYLELQGAVSTGDIAAELSVAPSSVTLMLKRLAGEGLIKREAYRDVELTASGRKEALRIIRKHRVIELFLYRVLGYGLEQVRDEAAQLGPAVSMQLAERMAEVMEGPRFDPHGDPIPGTDGSLPDTGSTPLADVDIDAEVRIVRVPDRDAGLLQYLVEMGLVPGAMISVAERLEDEQMLRLRLGDGLHNIGLEAAGQILVRPPEDRDDKDEGIYRIYDLLGFCLNPGFCYLSI